MTKISPCKLCGKVHELQGIGVYYAFKNTCEGPRQYSIVCNHDGCLLYISGMNKDIVIQRWNKIMEGKE